MYVRPCRAEPCYLRFEEHKKQRAMGQGERRSQDSMRVEPGKRGLILIGNRGVGQRVGTRLPVRNSFRCSSTLLDF